MKMTRHAHRFLRWQNIIFYILLALVIGLFAFFSREFVVRMDWTKGNRNSLAAPTQQLLQTLQGPIQFVAFVPDNAELHEQLKRLIGKYQRAKADVSLEIINPDVEPQRAQQEGIRHAGQLALHFNNRSEVLDSTSEQMIANALQRLSRGAERLVVFLEGHDERDPLLQTSNGMSRLVAAVERNGFRVQPHSFIRSQSVPNNTRFLVIAAPKQDLLEGEVALIQDFVTQGGNVLWLQDPGSLHGLQPLADLLGIRFLEGTVVDANEQLHRLLGVNHPAIVPVVDYGHPAIGANLTGLRSLFPFAMLVEAHPSPASNALPWKTSELLSTLPNSWLEVGSIEGAVTFDELSGDQLGPIPIGLTLNRLLDAPDAVPADSGGGQNSHVNADSEPLSRSREREQRVVVIGDSDFMINSFIGQGVNLDLATNIFNWLSADDNLLQVRTAVAPDAEFQLPDVVLIGVAIFFLVFLPLSLLITGLVIWLRRKRR